MKNLVKLSLVVLAVLALASCGNKSNTPEAVAEKFLNHLNAQEYAEAKELGTEATGEYLDMMSSLSEMAPDEEVEAAEITELKCEEKEATATCTYKTDGEEASINLVKEEDKWLVDMKKEDPMADDDFEDDMEDMEDVLDDVEEEMEEVVEEIVE
jgi:hypothetical protein